MSRRGPATGGDASKYAATEIMPTVFKAMDRLLEDKEMWDRHAAQIAEREAAEAAGNVSITLSHQHQQDGGVVSPRSANISVGASGKTGDPTPSSQHQKDVSSAATPSHILKHKNEKAGRLLDGCGKIEYESAHVPMDKGNASLTTQFRKAVSYFHPDRLQYERTVALPRAHQLPAPTVVANDPPPPSASTTDPLEVSTAAQSVAGSENSDHQVADEHLLKNAASNPLGPSSSVLPSQYIVSLSASRKSTGNATAAPQAAMVAPPSITSLMPTITIGSFRGTDGLLKGGDLSLNSQSGYQGGSSSAPTHLVPSTPSYKVKRCGELPVYICPVLPFYKSEMRTFVRSILSEHEPDATHVTFIIASTPGVGIYMKAETLVGADGLKKKHTGTGFSSHYEEQYRRNVNLVKAKGNERVLCFAEVIGERFRDASANSGINTESGTFSTAAGKKQHQVFQSASHPLYGTDGGMHTVQSSQAMTSLWSLAERDLEQKEAAIQAKAEADAEAASNARIEKRRQLEELLKHQQKMKEKAKVGKILGEEPSDQHHEHLSAAFNTLPHMGIVSGSGVPRLGSLSDGGNLEEEEQTIAQLSGLSPRSFGQALCEEREALEASAKFLSELGIDPARMDDLETEEFMLIRRLTQEMEQTRRASFAGTETKPPPGMSLTMSSANSGFEVGDSHSKKMSQAGKGRRLLRSIVKEILIRKRAEDEAEEFAFVQAATAAGDSLSSSTSTAVAGAAGCGGGAPISRKPSKAALRRGSKGQAVSAVASFGAAKNGPIAMRVDETSQKSDRLSDELVEVAVLKRLFPADMATRAARREHRKLAKERRAAETKDKMARGAKAGGDVLSGQSHPSIMMPRGSSPPQSSQPLRKASVVIPVLAHRRSSLTLPEGAPGATSALKGSRAAKTVRLDGIPEDAPKLNTSVNQPKKQVSLADTVLDALRANKEREEKRLVEVGAAVWELREACFKYRCSVLGIPPGAGMAGSSSDEDSDVESEADMADSALFHGRNPPTFEVTRLVHPKNIPLSAKTADALFATLKRSTDIQEGIIAPLSSTSFKSKSDTNRSVVIIVGLSEEHTELVRHLGTLACTYHTIYSELKSVTRIYNNYDFQDKQTQYIVNVAAEQERVYNSRRMRDARRAAVQRELEASLKLVKQLESPEEERKRIEHQRSVEEERAERRRRIDDNLATIEETQQHTASVTIQALVRGALLRLRLRRRNAVKSPQNRYHNSQQNLSQQQQALAQRDLRKGRFPVVLKALEYLSHSMGPNMVVPLPPRRNVPREVPFWNRTSIKVAPNPTRLVNPNLLRKHLQSIPRAGMEMDALLTQTPSQTVNTPRGNNSNISTSKHAGSIGTSEALSQSTQSNTTTKSRSPLPNLKSLAHNKAALSELDSHTAALCTSEVNLARQRKEADDARAEVQRLCELQEDVSSEDEEWEAQVTQRVVPDQRCPFCPLADAVTAMYAADVCGGGAAGGRVPLDLQFLMDASSGEYINVDGIQRKAVRTIEKLIGYMYFAAYCATRCKLDAGYAAPPQSHASSVFLQVPSKLHPIDTFTAFYAALGAPLSGWLSSSQPTTLHAFSTKPRKLLYGQRVLVGGPLVNGKWIADSVADQLQFLENKRQKQIARLHKHQMELWEQTQTILLRDKQQKDYDTLSRSRNSSSMAMASPAGRKNRTTSRMAGSVHVGRSMRNSVSNRASLGLDDSTTQAGGGISAMLASMLGGGRFSVRADFEHALHNIVNDAEDSQVGKVVRSWTVPMEEKTSPRGVGSSSGAASAALAMLGAGGRRGKGGTRSLEDDMLDDDDFGTIVGAASSSTRSKGDAKTPTKKEKISDMAMYGLPLYEPLATKALVDVFHVAAMYAATGSPSNPVRRNMLQPSKATSSVGKRATLPSTMSGLTSVGGSTSHSTVVTPEVGYNAFAHLLPPPFYIVPECISTEQWEEVASDVLNNELFRSLCGVPKLSPYHLDESHSRGRGSSSIDGSPEGGMDLIDGDGMVSELNMTHKRIVWFSTNPNPVVYCNGTPLYAVEPIVRTEGDAPAARTQSDTVTGSNEKKSAKGSPTISLTTTGGVSHTDDPCFFGTYSKLNGSLAPMFLPRDHSTLLIPNAPQSGGTRVFAPKVTASYGSTSGEDMPSSGVVLLNSVEAVSASLDLASYMDTQSKALPVATLHRDPLLDILSASQTGTYPVVEAPLVYMSLESHSTDSASPAPSLNVTAKRALMGNSRAGFPFPSATATQSKRSKQHLYLSEIEASLLEDLKVVCVSAYRGAIPFVYPQSSLSSNGTVVSHLQPLPLAALVAELTPTAYTKAQKDITSPANFGSMARMKKNRQSQHHFSMHKLPSNADDNEEDETTAAMPSMPLTIPPGKVFEMALRHGWSIKMSDLAAVQNAAVAFTAIANKGKSYSNGSAGSREDAVWKLLVGGAGGAVPRTQFQSGLLRVICESKTSKPPGAPISSARRLAAAWSTLFPLDPTDTSFEGLPFPVSTKITLPTQPQLTSYQLRVGAPLQPKEDEGNLKSSHYSPEPVVPPLREGGKVFDGIQQVADDEDAVTSRYPTSRTAAAPSPDTSLGGGSPQGRSSVSSKSPGLPQAASPLIPVIPDASGDCAYTVSSDFLKASEALAHQMVSLAEERTIVDKAPDSADACFESVGQVVRGVADLLGEFPQCNNGTARGSISAVATLIGDDLAREASFTSSNASFVSPPADNKTGRKGGAGGVMGPSGSRSAGAALAASCLCYHRIPMTSCDGGLSTACFSDQAPMVPKVLDSLYTSMLGSLDERRTAFVFSVHDGFQNVAQGVDALSGDPSPNKSKKASSSAPARSLTWNASKDGSSSLFMAAAGAIVYECDMLTEYRKVAAAEQKDHHGGINAGASLNRSSIHSGKAGRTSLPSISTLGEASNNRFGEKAPSGKYTHASFISDYKQHGGVRGSVPSSSSPPSDVPTAGERLKPWQLFPCLDRLASENPKLNLYEAMRTVDAILVATNLNRFFFDDVAFSTCMRLLGSLPSDISMKHIAAEEALLRAAEAKVGKARVAKEAAEKRISRPDETASTREAFKAQLDKEENDDLDRIYPEERRQRACRLKRQYVASQLLQRWLRVLMPSTGRSSQHSHATANSQQGGDDPFLMLGVDGGTFEGEELVASDILGGQTSVDNAGGALVSVLSIAGRSSKSLKTPAALQTSAASSRVKSAWQLLTVRDCAQRFEMYVHLVLFCAFVRASVPQRKLSTATGKALPRYVLFLEHSSTLKASLSTNHGVSPWEAPAPCGRNHRLQHGTSCDDLDRLLYLADQQRLANSEASIDIATSGRPSLSPKITSSTTHTQQNLYTRRGSVAYKMGGSIVLDNQDDASDNHQSHTLPGGPQPASVPQDGKAYFFQDTRRERLLSEQEKCGQFIQAFHPLSLHEAAYLRPYSSLDADSFARSTVWESLRKPHTAL